jgi:anion-transporting  ArsA/GET3 family ATPase
VPDGGSLLEELLKRRVVILTGKGGVGKSTTAAALGLVAAKHGKRVLLIEIDAKGNVPDFFDAKRVGFKQHRLAPNIHGLSMQPDESMREYLTIYMHLPGFSLKPLEGFMRYVSSAIPGLKEMLITGKIAYEERVHTDNRPRWDLIVVDGAPTGHVVSQLGAARELTQLVKTGPIHDQAVWMAELFSDQARCAVVLVTIPEEMPANETVDLYHRFLDETDIRPFGLILNQLSPSMLPPSELSELHAVVAGRARRTFLEQYPDGEPLLAAGAILIERLEAAAHFRQVLARALKLTTLEVPYIFERHHGLAFTRALAAAMEEAAG